MEMKKFIISSLLPLSLFAQQPQSEFPESSPSFEDISLPTEGSAKIPAHFRLRGRSLTTTYGKLHHQNTRFLFSEDDATLSYIFPTLYETILSLSAGYQYSLYTFDKNPLFKQNSFHNGFAAIGFQNNLVCDTSLLAELSAYTNLEYGNATLFYATGYGRYSFRDFGFALGAIYRTGIDSTRVWPIAGIDWTPNKRWDIHLIYPIDIAVNYHLNKCWTFSSICRLINNRQRLNKGPSIQYQNYGIELDATYEWNYIVFLQLGVGYLFAGELTVQGLNFNQDNVPFLNLQAALRF